MLSASVLSFTGAPYLQNFDSLPNVGADQTTISTFTSPGPFDVICPTSGTTPNTGANPQGLGASSMAGWSIGDYSSQTLKDFISSGVATTGGAYDFGTPSGAAIDKVYDGTTAAALNTGSAVLVGLLNGDTVTLNVGGASGTFASPDVGKKIPASISGLTISGPQAGKYSLTQPSARAKISAATLTVTADNQSQLYGQNNPALTASYSGFVNGETLGTSGVTGSPSLSTTATATSPPGNYAISAAAGSLSASNYIFQFVAGTLTVTLRTATWTGGAGTTSWADAANWSSNAVPIVCDQVVINLRGPLTITHAAGSDTIYSLTSPNSQVTLSFTGGQPRPARQFDHQRPGEQQRFVACRRWNARAQRRR